MRVYLWIPALAAVMGLGGRGAKFEVELLVTLLT